MNLITWSTFGVVSKSGLEKNVNIPSKISDNVLFVI